MLMFIAPASHLSFVALMTSTQGDTPQPPLVRKLYDGSTVPLHSDSLSIVKARNCVTVIHVDGLAVDHDGRTVALDLQRHNPGEVRQKHHGDVPAGYVGPYFVPEMPKVNLPIPPRPDQPLVELHLQLGSIISFNERNAVYNVRITRADPPAFYIPPLVIKVAQTDEAGRLLPKEAAMYEHTRKLQGVVAPRFYGYFHAKNRSSAWTRVSPRGSTLDTDELDADEGSRSSTMKRSQRQRQRDLPLARGWTSCSSRRSASISLTASRCPLKTCTSIPSRKSSHH